MKRNILIASIVSSSLFFASCALFSGKADKEANPICVAACQAIADGGSAQCERFNKPEDVSACQSGAALLGVGCQIGCLELANQ